MAMRAIGHPAQAPGLVRKAGAADADALAALVGEPVLALHDESTDALRDADGIAMDELRDPRIETLVLAAPEGVQGFLQLRWGVRAPSAEWMRGAVELRRHCVRVRHRGEGVAMRLLDAAMDAARLRAASCLWLKIDKRAAQALAFYGQHGFRIAGTAFSGEGAGRRECWVLHRMFAAVGRRAA